MSDADVEILDIVDGAGFGRTPPCADPRFDHRTCDYWEDDVRGSKLARDAWLRGLPRPEPKPAPRSDNPFAPPSPGQAEFNPFDPASQSSPTPGFNPFAPATEDEDLRPGTDAPPKLRLLGRGRGVFGSYAKVLLQGDAPVAYAQFGPLSAYPRAQQVRSLYPALPSAPLPAVITCVATTRAARGHGLGARLVAAVVEDLGTRGFAAVEAYPDLTLAADEASAANQRFWEACGFTLAAPDERFPVMRLELDR